MGDRKKKESRSKKPRTSEWPSIKPKSNLEITRLKDNDLFTVCSDSYHPFSSFFPDSDFYCLFNVSW